MVIIPLYICSSNSNLFSRYFIKVLDILAFPPLYIHFPAENTIPAKIWHNPKFYPYFRHAIGVIDGSHTYSRCPPGNVRSSYHNCKGFLSQNALFITNFDLEFTYMLTGWEGSAADARVYNDVATTDLWIPPGKYLLADASYAQSMQLLVPYWGVRYHLAEWGRAAVRYATFVSNRKYLMTICPIALKPKRSCSIYIMHPLVIQ